VGGAKLKAKGFPWPLTPADNEGYQQFVMGDALAVCVDRLDREGAQTWGEDKINAIYAKFA
jgi:hypothetical protein